MIYNYNRIILILIVSLTVSYSLWGSERIGETTSLGMVFYFKTDQDRIEEEYYSLGSKIKLQAEPMKHWKFRLEMDAGTDSVNVKEAWGRYKKGDRTFRFGSFDNSLLADDFMNSREYPFATDGYVKDRLDDMGWYSSSSLGAESLNFSVLDSDSHGSMAQVFYSSNSSELLLTAALAFPHAGKDSFMGVLVSYYPYFVHDLWGDSSLSLSSSSYDNGYYQDHYFLVNAFIGDMAKKDRLIYKMEYTAGNNLNDPIGFIQYPGEGDISWFFGSDFFAGYIVDLENCKWTPAVDISFYIHDFSFAEVNTTCIKLGNRLNWDDTFFLHFDAGVEINSWYDGDRDEAENLVTGLEILWGVSFQLNI